ncbi:MAG: globin, partial [Planctomycetia bacterium]
MNDESRLEEADVYAAIGDDGFRRLTAAFYRGVRFDPVLSPMYPPDDWAAAEDRLCKFLVFRFGGPQTYIAERGHPRLRMRHFPFEIGVAARNHWIQCMDAALTEAELPPP